MEGTQLETFLRRLRRVLGPHGAEKVSDAQLLERYLQHRDEQAFELIVWRHGLMVLNLCRRILRHEQDAEDAFQATFLALGRKAGAIGKRDSVGSWLYKVAYRVALRARNLAPTRSLNEGPLPDPFCREPIKDLLTREISEAIEKEIQRLPEKYRLALVLCHLEGQTIESAARSLDCPPATVGTWLARGRALLRRRLTRRGFDTSDVAGVRNFIAGLSAALVNSTVRAAMLDTAEQAAAAGIISASVATLTKGALQTMSLTRWIATGAIILSLSLLSGGALLAHRVLAVEPALPSSVPEDRSSSLKKRQPTAVAFRWKLKKGQSFYQIITTRTSQQMNVMNNDGTQTQEQTFYLRWTPLEVADDTWTLELKLLGVKMDIAIGGEPIKYDSTRAAGANSPNPIADFFSNLVGTKSKVILDASTLTVLRIDVRKDFINQQGAASERFLPLFDRIVGEDALKRLAEDAFGPLMGPARLGDSWITRQQVDMGRIGTYQKQLRCTYEGREDDLDKIAVKIASQKISSGKQERAGEVPFHVHKANLSGNGTGFLYFDHTKARLASSVTSVTLGGTLEIEIGGQKTHVDLLQTELRTVRTTDANSITEMPPRKGNEPLREENERLRKELDRFRNDNERLRQRLHAVEETLHREGTPNK
jgi:RNA polymerase sigma factor (sigma-70 family)